MNKDTSNVFSGGLNKDLNPIVTPNEILTDNVNGSFITFNGDEMSLQNDAGNTKILVPNKNEYVKLKEGYTPLGIKEYGGVLYIVSSNGTSVEFGSYPSPERPDKESEDGISKNITTLQEYVLSESTFQAGVDVIFSSNVDSTFNNYITTYDSLGAKANKKIYDVRLYHKLGSGLVDLTNYANKKAYPNKWYNSTTSLICYNNYKGVLVAKVLLEDIDNFELSQDPIYDKDLGTILFKLNTISNCGIVITGMKLIYNLNDGTEVTVTDTFDSISSTQSYLLSLGIINSDSIVNYKIIPILKYKDTLNVYQEITESEVPDYFLNYTINGVINLAAKPLDYVIEPIEITQYCTISGHVGMMAPIEYVLKNSNGDYIDNNLNIVTDKIYGFVNETAKTEWSSLSSETTPTWQVTNILGDFDFSGTYIGDTLQSYYTDSTSFDEVAQEVIYTVSALPLYYASDICSSIRSNNTITLTKSGTDLIVSSSSIVKSNIVVGVQINLSSTIINITLSAETNSTTYAFGSEIGSASILSLSVTQDDYYNYLIGSGIFKLDNEISATFTAGGLIITLNSAYTVTSNVVVTLYLIDIDGVERNINVTISSGTSSKNYRFNNGLDSVDILNLNPTKDWKYNYIIGNIINA